MTDIDIFCDKHCQFSFAARRSRRIEQISLFLQELGSQFDVGFDRLAFYQNFVSGELRKSDWFEQKLRFDRKSYSKTSTIFNRNVTKSPLERQDTVFGEQPPDTKISKKNTNYKHRIQFPIY